MPKQSQKTWSSTCKTVGNDQTIKATGDCCGSRSQTTEGGVETSSHPQQEIPNNTVVAFTVDNPTDNSVSDQVSTLLILNDVSIPSYKR